jgi:hypothetical protein
VLDAVSKPARPYVCRLIILTRLTLPSTGPELKGRLKPADTAANAWETVRGMLLRTTTAALLVRADGTVAVLGEHVTPNVLCSPDDRHLVITEKHNGRDAHMRCRLLDLAADTEHVMPWPTDDLTVRAAGLHERTVYFTAGGRPGLTMRWAPGTPPYPLKARSGRST